MTYNLSSHPPEGGGAFEVWEKIRTYSAQFDSPKCRNHTKHRPPARPRAPPDETNRPIASHVYFPKGVISHSNSLPRGLFQPLRDHLDATCGMDASRCMTAA